MQPNEIITASGLAMHFPGCEALRGVDLTVQRGQVFALLGENGAGKTTLIRILTGFQRATRGTCRVLGLDPLTDALKLRRKIGYVSDAPALYDWMTVGEIGWFAASFYPAGFLDAYRDLIAGYEVPETRKIKQLSKGQRAKVALSLAVAHDPELLILDEPTSGLDPLVRRDFLESMVTRAAAGRTVLLSSHQIAEVERVADTIAILHAGVFKVQGNLEELKESIVEVTVAVEEPMLSLPVLSGAAQIWSEETSGRQRRLVVHGFDESARMELEQHPGVQSIRQRPITLEELFVVCTRGHVREQVNIKPTAVPYGLQRFEI